MRYQAKVINAAMKVESMPLEASSEAEARHLVASAGLRLLSLRRAGAGLRPRAPGRAFNLSVFNQQLNAMLAAGQPVGDAVEILSRNDKAGRNRAIYDTVLDALRQGKQLSEAMAGLPSVFPSLYVAMVGASETTGTVRESIKRFMQYQKQIDDIRSKLTKAAIYPAILLIVGYVVVAFMMLYVVPRFSVVFDDMPQARTSSASFIQLWGGFVRTNTWFAVALFASFAAIFAGLIFHPVMRAWAGARILALPWLGERIWILRLARLYRTLSMLLRSGVSVLAAMRMTQASLPLAMQASLASAVQSISEGRTLSTVMAEQNLSTEVAQRLLVAGESSGNLDSMMEHIADFYDQEVATWIDTSSRLIEPILMVGIGLIVGLVVLMLYMPIFDLANIS